MRFVIRYAIAKSQFIAFITRKHSKIRVRNARSPYLHYWWTPRTVSHCVGGLRSIARRRDKTPIGYCAFTARKLEFPPKGRSTNA